MKTKFKVGDKVLITKPTEVISSSLSWVEEMDKFDGRVFEIASTAFIDIWIPPRYGIKETPYIFAESWLTKIEEQVTEQVTEQVAKPIDWEQRRWDLASKIYAEMENVTLESSVRQAEIFIKYYKQTLK